jgi:hypothetical protein
MSKKPLIPLLTITLMLVLTSATFARPLNTFSINLMPGGTMTIDHSDFDFEQFSLGLTVPMGNKLEFNGEIYSGDIDTRDNTTNYKLKCGYRLFEDSKVFLDCSAGLYQRNLDWNDYTVNSLTVGVDTRIKLEPKLYLYTGLSFGLISDEKMAGHRSENPDSLFLYHLKLNYLLNPKFGLALGYTSENINSKLLDDIKYGGFFTGAFFRF